MENFKSQIDKVNEFNIAKIFWNKGIVGPVSEKSLLNIKTKQKHKLNKEIRLHYFSIGHSFKQIDVKTLFEYFLDEEKKVELPSKFLTLQRDFFSYEFSEKLKSLISKIRNINSHYVHDFKAISTLAIDSSLVLFLRETFELALIQTYYKEKSNYPNDLELIGFIQRMFYPYINTNKKGITKEEILKAKERKTIIDYLNSLTKDKAIEFVLFIDLSEDKKWILNNEHEVFEITKGKYLSFEAMLFFLTMFLYKNEANHLVPKISGFKRNQEEKEKSKRNLFTFYSKKFTSQDIDAEEKHLIKFRDIIQYLNHYPTVWNNDLKLESENKNPSMTKGLIDNLLNFELETNYPLYATDDSFKKFAIEYLYASNSKEINLKNEDKAYFEELSQDPHIKIFKAEIQSAATVIKYNKREDAYKIFVKKYVLENFFPNKSGYKEFFDHKFSEKEKEDFIPKLYSNPKTNRLIDRISKNSLIVSHGRNQDRFMDIAMRYLAEKKYFGKEAKIKCYTFYDATEQDEFLNTQNSKEKDKLKFHKGKLTAFIAYADHLEKYPDWDCPFVEENNSVTILITLGNDEKMLTIQRNLMVYFLEDALYGIKKDGIGLLKNYYFNYLKKDFESYTAILNNTTSITNEQKIEYKKKYKEILPNRLLHHYSAAITNNVPEYNSYELMLKKAEQQDKRYKELVLNAEKNKVKEDFVKRNKGKQYKLQFIRKACQLMFFKDNYTTLKEGQAAFEKNNSEIVSRKKNEHEFGHHKKFNITREEFNDYSKWMFAFSGKDSYKLYLNDLFESKNFLDNKTFKKLFEDSVNLESFYNKTKILFKDWIGNTTMEQNEEKYKLENYNQLFSNKQLFINVSHFLGFLKENKFIKTNADTIQYDSLANVGYLNTSFYYKDKLEPEEYKNCGKLYNKLKTNKLEDCLLYEISFSYLNKDTVIKSNIKTILNDKLILPVHNATTPYFISVPFNKVDRYIELISGDKTQDFLANLQPYLQMTKIVKGKDRNGNKTFIKGDLALEDINTITNTMINDAVKFTEVLMAIEEYFILKDKTTIPVGEHHIDNKDIVSLHQFATVWKIWHNGNSNQDKEDVNFRNSASHLNLPIGKNFTEILLNTEAKFISNEIKGKIFNFNDLPGSKAKVADLFLKKCHNNLYLNLFQKSEAFALKNDIAEKKRRILQKYVDEIINKNKFVPM